MNRASVAIFFISRASIAKPWLNFELGYMEKSGSVAIICVAIDDVQNFDGPVAVHQIQRLPTQPKKAGDRLLALIGERIPISRRSALRNTIQIGSNIYPLQLGWQRYDGGVNTRDGITQTPFGISFGKCVDEGGFRYPLSGDSLEAPWEFLLIRANPIVGMNLYSVMELSDRTCVKLHASTNFDSVNYAPNQKDEFQIPVPRHDRRERLIINTQSYVRLLGLEPIAVRGLRVRPPTELSAIGMFDSRGAIPQMFRRRALELTLP
jgi:hypothetical protein